MSNEAIKPGSDDPTAQKDILNSPQEKPNEQQDDKLIIPTVVDNNPLSEIATEQDEEKESGLYWKELNETLNSPVTINEIKSFPEDIRGNIVGLVIEFFVTHRSSEGLFEYLDNLKEVEVTNSVHMGILDKWKNLLIQSVAQKLKVDANSVEGKRQIYDLYAKNYVDNGFFFHAFNGSFEKDISEKGLSNNERNWDWNDLKRVHEIGQKYGQGMLLGWGNINSEGKTFVSAGPSVSYRYGTASPEWFGQFVAEGFHVHDKSKKNAFYRRDYEAAKQNVINTCDQMKDILAEEKIEVMQFFEKYWAKFAGKNSEPKLALINRKAVQPNLKTKTLEDFCEITRQPIETVNLASALSTISRDSKVDIPIDHNVPPEELFLVNLPDYNKLFPQKS